MFHVGIGHNFGSRTDIKNRDIKLTRDGLGYVHAKFGVIRVSIHDGINVLVLESSGFVARKCMLAAHPNR